MIFNNLVRDIETFLQSQFSEQGIITPIYGLLPRAKFWRAFLLFISNLYQVSGFFIKEENYDIIFDYPSSIGDEVTVLTIRPYGTSNYVTF